jgi:hypothetical protein
MTGTIEEERLSTHSIVIDKIATTDREARRGEWGSS